MIATSTTIETSFDHLIPSEILPHREPMLLIDRVIYTDFENNITTETDIHNDFFFLKGHFPNYPLLPGVVILEMMFQACGILGRISHKKSEDKLNTTRLGKAVQVKSAIFYKEVRPGSSLIICSTKINSILNFTEYHVTASVDGEKVCKAQLTATIN